jgi:hypothetical protein
MIRLDMEQGSQEWIEARCGIPTASQFHRIITPKTMKLSSSSKYYLCELIAEKMLGASLDPFINEYMERGTEMEEQAVAYYEMQRELDTEKVGHCLLDSRLAGCSPDRLVGDDGGLEIKCPAAATHVAYMLDMGADKYRCQIQGSLWITGRKWWDFLSFNPEMPPVLTRHERDEEFIHKLASSVTTFVQQLDECYSELTDVGLLEEQLLQTINEGL